MYLNYLSSSVCSVKPIIIHCMQRTAVPRSTISKQGSLRTRCSCNHYQSESVTFNVKLETINEQKHLEVDLKLGRSKTSSSSREGKLTNGESINKQTTGGSCRLFVFIAMYIV